MVNFGPQSADQKEMAATTHALREGDDIVAGSDAVAEVQHFDGSLTRLDTGGTAALQRIADADGRAHVVLHLGPGAGWHRTSPTRVRGGRYEVQAPGAFALARSATFVSRVADDGSAWFAVLTGTVIVRGGAGGMVVLRTGETVAVSAGGALGDVSDPGPAALADDEWVQVNAVLDEDLETPTSAVEPAVEVFVVEAEAARPPARVEDAPVVGPRREHPWRAGVAAVAAMGLAAFSVFIGRSGTAERAHIPTADDAALAVPGPPAYATPPVTAPSREAEARADEATAAEVATDAPAPEPPPPAPAPEPEVTGRSCTRTRGGGVVYRGTLHSHAAAPTTYRVQVKFVDRSGTTVTTASATVADVAPGATRSFRASVAGTGRATACEVGRVDVVS